MTAHGVLRVTGMIMLAVAVSLVALALVYALQNSPGLIHLTAIVSAV